LTVPHHSFKSFIFIKLAIVTVLLSCLPAGMSLATLSRWLSLRELAEKSDLAVRGRIESVRVEWSDGPARFPVTVAVIEVRESLLGSAPAGRNIEVRQPGGHIDGIVLEYGGRPRLTEGDDSVLFLRRGTDGSLMIVGLAQGVLRVVGAEDSTGPYLVRDLRGMVFVDSPPREAPVRLPPPGGRTRLEDLRRELSRLQPGVSQNR
jgi:hypothetical protein